MLLRINPDNIDDRLIWQVVNCLRKGGVIIYPTDTVYTLGCDLTHREAYEKVCKIKDIKPNKANFSIVCYDLSHITDFTMSVPTPVYKMMKRSLPGPYTYILNGNNNLSKIYGYNKKTVGIRVPNNTIARAIVDELGAPILSASIKNEDTVLEYIASPDELYEIYENIVDIVIDGGPGGLIASTVVDYTGAEPLLVREGAGEFPI
ncbi:MAG TPA: L-threonylcarbamoyladenylate synthase [Chitinophagales bacterium]|nr:L-threonylcarbamoyladenylate synthase [Chitinophagales bacterium]